MKILIPIVISVFLIMIFSGVSLATPFLHDLQPANNSYTRGGIITISINITDDNPDINSAVVKLIEVGAYQQGEEWVTQSLSCTGNPNEWRCSTNFITSTIGSDTVELFYFEANDTDNVKGNNGTASSPLRFTLDRNPPIITFISPANKSYVSGNKTISLIVADASSGTDNNTIQFSTDNSSWTTLKNVSSNLFETIWDTASFPNNQTVTLYAGASDNVRNNATLNINVTVDNEIPQIVVLSNLSGSISGNMQLQVNVSDNYSGINLGDVRYSVGGVSGTLGCAGTNYNATCSAVMNSANLQDGNHTLTFIVTDKAGNSNTSSVQIKTSNTQPSISLIEPVKNAFVRDMVLARVNIVNSAGLINYVELSIGSIVKNMACDMNFSSCNYSLNTTSFVDGGYTLKAKAVNSRNLDVSSSITVNIDNTKPVLVITQPLADVKDDFEIKGDVIDANLNQNKVSFKLSSFTGNLSCTPQTPSKFICSTAFGSKQLNDGKYTLSISAEDKAGNSATESKEITVVNRPTTSPGATVPGSSEQTSASTKNESKTGEEKKSVFPRISLPFKIEYILVAVVIAAVFIIVIILAVIVKRGLGKTIITDK